MKKPPPIETQFQPGHGKLGGRKRGTRNMLCEAFIADLVEHWREKGAEIIRMVHAEDPAVIMKVIAQLCPKELEINPNAFEALTDDQLSYITGMLRSRRADDPAGDRDGTEATLN